jgi:hypothetical protein
VIHSARAAARLMLLVAVSLVAHPARSEAAPAPSATRVLEQGSRGVVLTAVSGSRIEEIPLTYIGTYRDFAGPGYDLILVQLEGPIADRVGVAAGMSGSPVYIDGELIGALAYRIGRLPQEAVAGVTPLADVIDAAKTPSVAGSRTNSGAAPIATPISVGGMVAEVRDWLAGEIEEQGFVLVGGGGAAEDAEPPGRLTPGSPVGVELVRGDLSIAATGTVTWVDGQRVYAFGHPFTGSGRVEMPMVAADVIYTLGDLAGSMRLSSVGGELGAIVEDRLTAIVGHLGAKARMIPVRLRVQGADYGEERFEFEIARSGMLTPVLAGAVVGNALLSNTAFVRESTMRARGTVTLAKLPDLPIEVTASGIQTANPGLAIAGAIHRTLSGLWVNPFGEVEIDGITLEVDVSPEVVQYQVQALLYDRLPLRPGDTLDATCVLRAYRGETVTRQLSIRVPSGLVPDRDLALSVGSPTYLEGILGRPLTQRLHSAEDLPSFVRALGSRWSADRLKAVLYQAGAGVVRGGALFEHLPPTAARLLAADLPANATQRRRVARLAVEELQLDGPAEGGVTVRIRVDSALEVAPPQSNEEDR